MVSGFWSSHGWPSILLSFLQISSILAHRLLLKRLLATVQRNQHKKRRRRKIVNMEQHKANMVRYKLDPNNAAPALCFNSNSPPLHA
ncbi:hypothetical protein NC653_018101 [Populus alba x Populus x berolinensis]|uniref:Uncharacterized protein n=1 Tax=Populus alba x Populus x berolinensis TaxID=444605 RepID=A0AAD6QS21_9ROSI|nr:hypothetical protein NC653_018101 [Populus alba x Populus x berolinensis]